MTAIVPILTQVGLNAAVTAAGSGLQIALTHIAFGSGQYTPAVNGSGNATQTAMVARLEKATFGGGTQNGAQVTLAALFPEYGSTPYNVGEIGIWAGDPDAGGILFAIYSTPTYVHALRNSSLQVAESYSFRLNSVPLGSVTVTVDPSGAALSAVQAQLATLSQYLIPDTGTCLLTLQPTAKAGWVMADDGTIGNAASGATNRANADTSALFQLIWNNVSNTFAPIFTSTGAISARGTDALTDFNAGKRLKLGLILGRAIGVAGSGLSLTARALMAAVGTEGVTLTGQQSGIQSHKHQLGGRDSTADNSGTNPGDEFIQPYGYSGSGAGPAVDSSFAGDTDADQSHPNMQPTVFLNLMIKL